jgi:hypothetical protein
MLVKKGLIIPSLEEPPVYLPAKDLETINPETSYYFRQSKSG